ncbi:MAG: arylsulfatase [Synoicihabitans sp.]
MRADCIAALGNSQIRTPNIDRLVNEGTAFTRCYSPSPVCMPARHSLTCGAPPHQTGCVDNLPITCDRRSFMDELGDLGYQTHGIGKMHFAKSKGDWGFQSRDHSEELDGESQQDDYRAFLADKGYGHIKDPHGFRSEFYYLPQPSQLPEKLHNNTWVADRSIAFLQNRDHNRPFLLWTSFIKPHPPFESPYPWSRLYRMHEMDGPFLPEDFADQQNFWNKVQCRYKYLDSGYSENLAKTIKAAYYSTISHLDFHVGRILDSLGSEIDNTLIVFTSDHGEMLGDYGCYGKRTMLDASARVPLLARLPGTFAAGARVDQVSTLLDLFPTFLEAGAGEAPSHFEGVSLQRLQHQEHVERFVHSQFSQNQLGLYMVTNREWKYIFSAADDREWLYRDGCENVNLAEDPDYAGTVAKLRSQAITRFRADGYEAPLDGDEWARFPKMDLPSDPAEGRLFQDPADLATDLEKLGPSYARNTINPAEPKYNLLQKLAEKSKRSSDSFRESTV